MKTTVADKIGSFHKVFGDGSSQHAGRYPEAARRGSTIVTVTLKTTVAYQRSNESWSATAPSTSTSAALAGAMPMPRR